jgi:hypothetical protein
MAARITNADIMAAITGLAARVEALEGNATVVAKPAQGKARTRKTTGKPLTKANRKAFVAAALKDANGGPDFTGMSTKAIAEYCVTTGYAPKGFRIGEGYTALFS